MNGQAERPSTAFVRHNLIVRYMKTKECRKCGIVLPLESFRKHPETRDKHCNYCNACLNEKSRNNRRATNNAATHRYEKTPKGFLMREYRNMQSRVTGIQKKKAHLYLGKELLPRDEFYKWAMFHIDFVLLYTEWTRSNYDRKLTPTVDRINSAEGYVLSNMEWVTHSENSRRGCVSKCLKYGHKIYKGKVYTE